MKRLLYFLFFTLLSSKLFSQIQPRDQSRNDSLLIILRQGKTDSIRARAAFHLSKIWINLDSARGLEYLQQGNTLSKGNEYLNAIYRYQAIPSYRDEKEVNAILAIFRKYDHPDAWDYTYRVAINRVRWLINQALADKALAMLQRDIMPLAQKLKNPAYDAEIALEMGRSFVNQSMYNEAVPYLEKAVARYESIQPKEENLLYNHIHTLGSLANVYNLLERSPKADSTIRRANELLLIQPNLAQKLRITSFEAMHLLQNGNYQKAEKLINHTLDNAKGVPPRYLLNLHFQGYKARAGLGDKQGALRLLKKSHPIDSIHLNPEKFGTVDLSELLPTYASAYEQIGDHKQATFYWKRYIKHRDSVSKDQIATQISKLEVQLRTQEKDAAIQHLKAEQNEITLLLKNQRIFTGLFTAAAILLLTLLGFILYIYKSKQKINANRIHQLETDNQLKVTKALLEGEERERQRIGRDLHDGLGGTLAGIHIQLSESQQQRQGPTLDRAITQLEGSIAEIRRIARNMVPENLFHKGLDTALRDLCISFSTTETQIEYQSSGLSDNLSNSIQTNLYRIVQELLSNALRHGKAKNIIVQCIQNEDTLLLTVEDDGLGFDTQNKQNFQGIGLKNIQSRVNYMQGQYAIESAPGQGTTINIEIHVS
ncbi:sensor histidine kinase [Sphingobacterium tabacisoli]|uniref:histidine kinase n=1 Tax=Sphingobacterium tabacisoli TaxID=2044855 RepID=A0ABW5KZY8_9SPHI|nr:sensor histidine kinase [Sphingobacterium tabacisoli]